MTTTSPPAGAVGPATFRTPPQTPPVVGDVPG